MYKIMRRQMLIFQNIKMSIESQVSLLYILRLANNNNNNNNNNNYYYYYYYYPLLITL